MTEELHRARMLDQRGRNVATLRKNALVRRRCERYLRWWGWFPPLAYRVRDSLAELNEADADLRRVDLDLDEFIGPREEVAL